MVPWLTNKSGLDQSGLDRFVFELPAWRVFLER